MNKRTIIFTAIAGMVYIGTTSYHGGAAADGGLNRTGAKGSMATCAGAGCHSGTTPASIAAIYIDSAGGIPVTKYTPGKTYTITVVGKHSVNNEFGFQFAAVSGTGAAQVQAGSFGSSLPVNVGKKVIYGLDLIEHTDHVAAISPADSFIRSFAWTAPAANVGNVTLYLTVNAINGNHMPDAGDFSSNISKVLQPYSVSTAIEHAAGNIGISVFPNPVTNTLHIRLAGISGQYSLRVFDRLGTVLFSATDNAGLNTTYAMVNTTDWAKGIYNVEVENNGLRNVIQLVK